MVNYLWDNLFRSNTEEQKVRQFLKDCHLFKDLNSREIKLIENVVHVRRFQSGETVFNQGEMGTGMYLIFKGQINIYTRGASPIGEDHLGFLTRLIEGDFMGELSLIEESSRRTATALAHEECSLIGFFKPDLLQILERNPSAGAKVLFRLAEVLGRRLKETTTKVTELKREIADIQLLDEASYAKIRRA